MSNDKPLISFDYAIKYLLKNKEDYGIVEGFISELLQAIGYHPVKIVALLDPESNAEEAKSKRSLADLIVKDENLQYYIVEIERQLDEHFIHKACFNTSRLVVDSISKGDDYANIKKVFHISLLYFPIGNSGPIYRGDDRPFSELSILASGKEGNCEHPEFTLVNEDCEQFSDASRRQKTILGKRSNGIYEIKTKERLTYTIQDPDTKIIYDATNILPEHLFISVPMFKDRLQREIDDWLYVMKYDEVPKEFHSKYMQQVAERLSILKMSSKEFLAYKAYRKKLLRDQSELRTAINKGRIEGEAKGKVEGKTEEKIETAKRMLKKGIDTNTIQETTELSLQVIQDLAKHTA